MRHSGFVRQAGRARRPVSGHRHDPCVTQAGRSALPDRRQTIHENRQSLSLPGQGLIPEALASVDLAAGTGFPLDRKYALLRTDAAFNPTAPTWLSKANFVILMLHEPPVGLRTRYAQAGELLSICTARYFPFDPHTLDPEWRTAWHLPDTYRCPDCGAGRDGCIAAAGFRPSP